MRKSIKRGRLYSAMLLTAFCAGFMPFIFNVVVDPYDMNDVVDLDLDKFKVSEPAHYPLWKMIHFPKKGHEAVVLGDSRARALREKLWRSLGADTYNFAYGGATIYEIFDTFEHVKDTPNLKTLVVGLPLRSFDPAHRRGLNRVPEAIELSRNPFAYYKSWFVAKIGWRNLERRYPENVARLRNLASPIFAEAKAFGLKDPAKAPLTDLLNPDVCEGCDLPDHVKAVPHPIVARRLNFGTGRGLGLWDEAWPPIAISRELPRKFERQVRKNGRNDWEGFKFSEELFAKIAAIAEWSKANNVKLVFVIPPTIPEMQERMSRYGWSGLNNRFRLRLAELAPVFDFDFDSPLTRDLSQFTDAYHFKGKAAKAMVGEILQLVSDDRKVVARARKRRSEIVCPISESDQVTDQVSDGIVEMKQGVSCRIWRWSHD
ncbi:MAG: hypothetical protein AAGE61_00190 [Pseudomonadota bacterium]